MISEAKKAANARSAAKYKKTPRGRATTRARRQKWREMLRALKDRPCMDCGGRFDVVCMDFDHRPGETKLFEISHEVGSVAIEKLLAEVTKCDVVCANCHRVRTHRLRVHAQAGKVQS